MRLMTLVAICAIVIIPEGLPAAIQQPGQTAASSDRQPATVRLPAGDVAHGRYLVEHVAMCVECHSGRDASGNILDRERYLGGNIPPAPPWGKGWATRAPRNRGLVGYEDDQLALRLLTEGAIGRDGRELNPPMPRFRMSVQDAADVIAFLRSLH